MNLLKTYWLQIVLVLQFILLVALAGYTYYQLHRHETAILNEASAITQVVNYLNNATKTTQ